MRIGKKEIEEIRDILISIEEQTEIIKNTLIGIIIACAAWLIINTILFVLIDPNKLPLPWNEFPSCPTLPAPSTQG